VSIGLIAGVIGALVAAVAATFACVYAISRPQYMVYPYLTILFFFPLVSWGAISPDADIYSRGTGVLFFPLVTWYLWGMAFIALIRRFTEKTTVESLNISKYFWLFNLLFLAHVLVAALVGHSLEDTFSMNGIIGVVNLSIFFFVIVTVFDRPEDLRHLATLIVMFAVARGLYGVVRFFVFGGDPSNVYANLEDIDVRLTFYDINDSLIAMLAAFIVSWRLVHDRASMPWHQTLAYLAVLALELFVIVFSYRRAAWVGLLLAAILFLVLIPRQQRRIALLGAAAFVTVSITAILIAAEQRFASGPYSGGSSLLTTLLPDFFSVGGGVAGQSDRVRELFYGFETFLGSPLVGIGAWGRYEGLGIAWHFGTSAYSFMHSGFGHVAFKSGLLGLLIFVGMLIAAASYAWRVRRSIPPQYQALCFAGLAGLAFLVPTLVLSTPIIEIRTMQLLGLVLALPYMAARIARQSGGKPA
jgi:hypothetical protein